MPGKQELKQCIFLLFSFLVFVPCKGGIRILGSRKFLLVQSGSQKLFAGAIRKPANFCCKIRNPGLWKPEYSSKNPESHKRLESRIQLPSTKNPKVGKFLLVESGIQQIFALETGILGFRAQGIRNLSNNWNPEFKFH